MLFWVFLVEFVIKQRVIVVHFHGLRSCRLPHVAVFPVSFCAFVKFEVSPFHLALLRTLTAEHRLLNRDCWSSDIILLLLCLDRTI